ncbi:uncharacterized protein K02A2.6-like [Corythoichthys intestinalis]|uniref:uncharacterized protein K02A2.6-like n=1 Tax=Corythoichthys intestinalis TaxID=161448 RepID=UPI0025A4E05E|nr:uncharacterized protein K02A2.6-like [Corythoichthys intestinalis]
MDKVAEKYVRTCHGCQIVSRPDVPEPLRPTALPDGPWQDLATDLLGPLPTGHSILVVIDYYSRYYEYEILQSTTAEKVIDSLENIFSRHGLPISIRSDCGPQYMSAQFQAFCQENGIEHVKTTPKWAQANGEVERQNASLMKRIRIAQSEGLDWKKELRKYVTIYRSIDHATTGSPAELMFKRKIRGKLPDITTPQRDLEVRDTDAERKGKSKIYTDNKTNAKYSDVSVGDQVLLKQDKIDKFTTTFNRTPHKVISKEGNNVVVEAPSGVTYSRNTTFVKKYYTEDPAPQSSSKTQMTWSENEDKPKTPDMESNTEIQTRVSTPKAATAARCDRPRRQIRLPSR